MLLSVFEKEINKRTYPYIFFFSRQKASSTRSMLLLIWTSWLSSFKKKGENQIHYWCTSNSMNKIHLFIYIPVCQFSVSFTLIDPFNIYYKNNRFCLKSFLGMFRSYGDVTEGLWRPFQFEIYIRCLYYPLELLWLFTSITHDILYILTDVFEDQWFFKLFADWLTEELYTLPLNE